MKYIRHVESMVSESGSSILGGFVQFVIVLSEMRIEFGHCRKNEKNRFV
jgi:hypothetical protein